MTAENDSMSERPTRCPEGHDIEWLTEVVGVCGGHDWTWEDDGSPSGRLRRISPTAITDALVITLREAHANLTAANATIAELRAKLDAEATE